jgi:hypothetical protein
VPVLPVTSLFGELSGGVEVTSEVLLGRLMTSDANLSMITQIDVPAEFSLFGVLAGYAESKGLVRTGKRLREFMREFRENMVSFQRQGRKEVVQGVVADMERGRREDEGVKDKLVGSRGSR